MGILPLNYAQYCTSLTFHILSVSWAFPPLPLNEEKLVLPSVFQSPASRDSNSFLESQVVLAALKHLWDSLLAARWHFCVSHAILQNCSANPKVYDPLEPMTSQVPLHIQAGHPNLTSFVTQSQAAPPGDI